MLSYLDRFSVDLDFDLKKSIEIKPLRKAFRSVFESHALTVKTENKYLLTYVLQYENRKYGRNSIKLNALPSFAKSNIYTVSYFPEIDRYMGCQTIDTMFANKLVAVTDRYNKYKTVAGRDIYDIHHFFYHGYSYNKEVIQERTGLAPDKYIAKLISFIKRHITQSILSQDLDTLLPYQKYHEIRKILIPETLMFLHDELKRLCDDN